MKVGIKDGIVPCCSLYETNAKKPFEKVSKQTENICLSPTVQFPDGTCREQPSWDYHTEVFTIIKI